MKALRGLVHWVARGAEFVIGLGSRLIVPAVVLVARVLRPGWRRWCAPHLHPALHRAVQWLEGHFHAWRTRETDMAPGEGRLLAGAAAAETPSWMFRTRTTVDVGSWLRKRRIWACLMSRDLVLVASGKRPFTEVVPLRQLGESRYNHVTGELLLGPADGVRNVRLRMPPFEGYEVLWRIRNKEDYDA